MKLVAAMVGAVLALWSGQGWAQVERLYAFDCGQGRVADQSRWSPGVNVGVPRDFGNNCYLVRHAQGWLLWETGLPDRVASMPDGLVGAGGAMVWRRPVTLAAQLAAVGVAPDDIRYIAVSHSHGDHVGNVDLFPKSTLLIQKAEWDHALTQITKPFATERPVTMLEGDKDVFGDGSVTIVSTPGHTPGHQCLLVKLPKTGVVLLSGDAAHFQENWDNRRVPMFNFDKEKTAASMERMAALLAEHKGQLWLGHDKAQSDAMRRPPAYYE